MIRRTILLFLVLALTGNVFFSCNRSMRPFYEEGVSEALAKYRERHVYDVHYTLFLSIPEKAEEAVSGNVQIDFKPLKAQHGLVVDFQAPEDNLLSVSINGSPSTYDFVNGHIFFESGSFIPRQNNVVEIEFISTNQALNRSDDFMYTLVVPDKASTVFPCFDQPDLKASFDLCLDIPEGWTALANGVEYEHENSDNRICFKKEKPISTYLFAFTAGKFQIADAEKNGRSIRMFHREEDTESRKRNLDVLFEQHFHALQWMEEYTGIAYPYAKFDMAILPGFQYSGMEHPGAVWYRDSRLFLDENPSRKQELSRASLIAHEVAHMWFGNLVTMKWFDDVWLKEVFAGFFADRITEEQFTEMPHDLNFVMSHFPRAYSVARTAGRHPIKQSLDNLKNAGLLYGAIIYNKAPIVFRQLEYIMGEQAFRLAIREYLHTYAHSNADWDDLVNLFDGHSPVDIKKWSRAWVYGEGIPELRLNDETGIDKGFIELEWSKPDYDLRSFPQQYISPVLVFTDTIIPAEMILLKQNPTIQKVVADDLQYIIPSGGGWGYAWLPWKEKEMMVFKESISLIDDGMHRAALYLNMHENFLQGNFNPTDYFHFLLHALEPETESLSLDFLLGALKITAYRYLDFEEDKTFANAIAQLLWNQMQEGKEPSLLFDYWVKLGRSPSHFLKMQQLYEGKERIPGMVLSEENIWLLVTQLQLRGMDETDWVEKHISGTSDSDRKRRYRFVQASLSRQVSEREAFFEQLRKPENRNPEPWVLEALSYLHHPLRQPSAERFLETSLDMIGEIQRTGDIFFPTRWLHAIFDNYPQEVTDAYVHAYLATDPQISDGLKGKVKQLILE